MSDLNCGSGGGATTYAQLRIASIFIVLVGSMGGSLFPVLAKRTSWLHVPKAAFE
jgi:zinc transporter 1/2/3